jgi:hypothetical protein
VVQSRQIYVPKYVSEASDILWASKGMVVTVLNGEVIPVLQRQIYDAGFGNLRLYLWELTRLFFDHQMVRMSVLYFRKHQIFLVIFSRNLSSGIKKFWFVKEVLGLEYMVCLYMLGILLF